MEPLDGLEHIGLVIDFILLVLLLLKTIQVLSIRFRQTQSIIYSLKMLCKASKSIINYPFCRSCSQSAQSSSFQLSPPFCHTCCHMPCHCQRSGFGRQSPFQHFLHRSRSRCWYRLWRFGLESACEQISKQIQKINWHFWAVIFQEIKLWCQEWGLICQMFGLIATNWAHLLRQARKMQRREASRKTEQLTAIAIVPVSPKPFA